MDTNTIFSELRRRIAATGMTQSAIAEALDIQQSSISRFLSSRTGLQADVFLKLLLFVGGGVTFGDKQFDESPCIKEREMLRSENDQLKQRIVELEAENRTQQRMLDKLLDGLSLSSPRKNAG